MKVLYDHQIFNLQLQGGVSRYFCEIIKQFLRRPSELQIALAVRESSNRHLADLGFLGPPATHHSSESTLASLYHRCAPLFPGVRTSLFMLRRYLGFADEYARATRQARRVIRTGDFDLLHPTYYDPYFLEEIGDRPYVVTVYDLIHELFADRFPALAIGPTAAWKRKVVADAALIIAISETTKRDLVRLLGVPHERVVVIHLASALAECAARTRPIGRLETPERFLLFVGRRSHYKNFGFFMRSAVRTLNEHRVALVCVGGGPPTSQERGDLRAIGAERLVRFVQNVSDEFLVALFRDALAYVSPSLYEGFGLPTLDAFAVGCPVLLSAVGAHAEVAGPAAEYFDPTSEGSIQGSLARVIGDRDLRERLIRLGEDRLTNFSWERAARQTVAVYRAALKQHGRGSA